MMTSAPTLSTVEIEEIRLDRARARLHLAFAGGPGVAPARASLDASALRAACRCAGCVADRARGRFDAAGFSGVTLATVAPFGAHGLNLTFSDGHARGVYPFAYLAALATGAAAATDTPEVTP
ncbi:DUF971 domain-containing protein [Xanthobacter sp. V3C-3]|uniref:DUF971 domain-containing protein n=1 Tax=Xanthobacter lutulentifluminis TaxID=3119935 RepID=UPI003729F9C1